MATDAQLLREFATTGAEAPFTELVRRHAGLVHAAALRQTQDPHLADEVTQAVFVLLARKAATLRPEVVLLGWLMHAARFAANDLLRAERRRRLRETAAFQMNSANADSHDESTQLWERVAPVLDVSLDRLREPDRSALLLRFFRNCSLAEVGAALGIAEEAARKRVTRALDRLREELQRQGVVASVTSLPGLLAHQAAGVPAPDLVAPTVLAALRPGAAESARAVALSKVVAAEMAWTTARTWIATAAAALVLLGGAGWAGQKVWDHWQRRLVVADGDYRAAGFGDARVVHAFIRDLQQRIRAGDRSAVTQRIRYPLRVNGRGFAAPLENPAGVLAIFEHVFTESVAGEILKCPAQGLHCTAQGVMIGGGSVWIAPEPGTGNPQIALINLP